VSHARSKSCSQSAGYDREMQQLLAGLWHWQAPHPDWAPTAHWPQQVSSYAVDDGTTLLLFDPLAVPQPLLELARVRIPVIVLTAPWHERDTQTLLGMLRCPVFTPSPDTAEDLVRKYGITLQQAGSGSPDLAWLLSGPSPGGEAHFYAAGDRLALGIDVFPGRVRNDVVLWLDSLRVLIAGDTLADFGHGLEIPSDAVTQERTPEQIVQGLRALLQRPVEHVLPTHGLPTDRSALDRLLG
jgi:glyoxylase-like metal-dependent hydrolase (beta-lactamase superfamily II)